MNMLPLALFGDIGGGELLVVMAAILVLFGGKGLPSIARTIGKTMEELRKASHDFKKQILNADAEMQKPSLLPHDQPPAPLHGHPAPPPAPPSQEPPPRDFAG